MPPKKVRARSASPVDVSGAPGGTPELPGRALDLFRPLLEVMPDAMVVVEQTGAIVLANAQAERLFGYTRAELLGQPVEMLVPARYRGAHRGHREGYFRAASLRPMGSGMELHAVRWDGQEFSVEISLGPLDTSTGTLVVCAIRDVTVQRQAQREAEQTKLANVREANERLILRSVRAQMLAEEAEQDSQLKDEFLATVSHELRTPLNAILGWARLLSSKALTPARAEHATVTIERNAAMLATMVDDLLDVARIVKGGVRLALRPVDLPGVAQAALDAVRPLAAAGQVNLTFDAAPGLLPINGDAGRLQQVLWNLLTNAVKFTPAGGHVALSIAASVGHLEVRVVDTGEGIAPDLLPHVFERFRQAPDATTQRHTGIGLGLSIVRELVTLHGGTVDAASDGVGCGATFTVHLPCAPDPELGGHPLTAGV